jgi:inner membrane protein
VEHPAGASFRELPGFIGAASFVSGRAGGASVQFCSSMASIGHVALGLAAGRAYATPGTRAADGMLLFSFIALWPDVDVAGFAMGIPYESPFGHRGATHSFVAAGVVTVVAALVCLRLGLPLAKTVTFVAVVAVSHCILDTVTFGGGLGCELLWPFSDARLWAPVRFIPVAPIGIGMLSLRGLRVAGVETLLFVPLWLYALWPRRPRAK